MSETPKKLRLDDVLHAWPDGEKSPMEWEEMALHIEERVASGTPGATVASISDENLFAAPLGQIEGEGHNSAAISAPGKVGETRVSKGETMTMPADRERDRRSLQDLAKLGTMGLTPPPPSVRAPNSSAPSGVQRAAEAKKDDSGIVDLAMAAQSDPQAAMRAQSTPLASDGLFDDEPASIKPGPVSSAPASHAFAAQSAPVSQQFQQPAPSIPPFSAPGSAPSSLPPGSISQPLSAPISLSSPTGAVASSSQQAIAPVQAKKGNGKVIGLVLSLVAVGSIAAGGVFFMKHRAAEQLAKSTPVVTQPVAAPADPAPKPVEAANTTPAPAADPSLDPNALPTATPDTKVAAAPKVAAKGGAPAAVAKNDKPAPAPAKEEGPKLSAKDLPTTPTGPGGDLGSAMGAAVGADNKKSGEPTPAAGNNGPQFAAGTVPQKPSQGAVTGAIGAVLPNARQCLGPDDPVSRAAITFTSAGTVQSVNVTGGAAGKPAEGCIKGALGKAKVAPFAEATYTANITVRH